MRLFHIAEPIDWQARTETYEPPSLQTEGFIHCSTGDQLRATAKRFFAGRSDVILLEIDGSEIADLVVFEDLCEVGEEFPHIYGPLPVDSVIAAGILETF